MDILPIIFIFIHIYIYSGYDESNDEYIYMYILNGYMEDSETMMVKNYNNRSNNRKNQH